MGACHRQQSKAGFYHCSLNIYEISTLCLARWPDRTARLRMQGALFIGRQWGLRGGFPIWLPEPLSCPSAVHAASVTTSPAGSLHQQPLPPHGPSHSTPHAPVGSSVTRLHAPLPSSLFPRPYRTDSFPPHSICITNITTSKKPSPLS